MKRLFHEAGTLIWLFVGAVACAVVVSVATVAFADIFGRSLSLVVAGAGLQALRQVIVVGVVVGVASVRCTFLGKLLAGHFSERLHDASVTVRSTVLLVQRLAQCMVSIRVMCSHASRATCSCSNNWSEPMRCSLCRRVSQHSLRPRVRAAEMEKAQVLVLSRTCAIPSWTPSTASAVSEGAGSSLVCSVSGGSSRWAAWLFLSCCLRS
ncbi:MAG: hypothetical protein NTZ77_03890 [Caldiserica bacterium]|nr:hypothetical protein [Caldisericota bacterium]